MDKSVIFAVAGSGKTTHLIERLSLERRALIITYTDNNFTHLRSSIIRKFGLVPKNITLMSYFSFLYGFCYRPFLELQLKTRGLRFRLPSAETSRIPRDKPAYYRDGQGNLYHNRLAKLLEVTNTIPQITARIERFYDDFFVDEVQDFAGHDFNLLMALAATNVNICLVGDFFQHTFDTSRDGNVNSSLHNDVAKYEKRFIKEGIIFDKTTLSHSWRCGTTVCDFIQTHLQINMQSHYKRETEIIHLSSPDQADLIHADSRIVKLFYQSHSRYGCCSNNWGASKGLDHYDDVCVVLGGTHWRLYQKGKLNSLPAQTRNKLYVALSRTRGKLYLAPDKYFSRFKTS